MFKYFYKNPIVTGFIGFLVFLIITQLLTNKDYRLVKSNERELVVEKVTLLEKHVVSGLGYSLSAAKTLEMLIDRIDLNEEFEEVASDIIAGNPYIDALQVLDSGTITHTYPIFGNGSVIGYDILKDKTRNTEAIRAIKENKMFFAGPFELVQGGTGIVGRLPIYREGNFIGFTAVVIRLETFYRIIGFDSLDFDRYYYQFSKINPDTGQENNFLPLPTSELNGHRESVPITMGDWILTVQLKESKALSSILIPSIFRLMFSLMSGIAIWYLANQPYKLNRKVEEQAKAIKLSNERFSYVVKATSDAIWDWDMENNTVYRSENFKTLFGHAIDTYTTNNKFWVDNIHPKDVKRVSENIADFFESDRTNWIQEFRFRKADGTYAFIVDKGILIRNLEGKPKRMIGASQDITRIKNTEIALATEKEFLNSLLENLSDGIVACSASGKIKMFNKASRKLFGVEHIITTIEQWGESCEMYNVDGTTPISNNKTPLHSALNGEVVKDKELVIHPNGSGARTVLCSGKTIYSATNKMIGAVVVLRDITENRKKEKELESSNRELEQFAHTVSHDLQEPLRMISSFMKILETKYEPIIDEKGKRYIHYAIDGASRMRQIILDLLEYSTSGSKDKLERVCLAKVMNEIIEIEKHQIEKLGAMVKIGPLPAIYGSKISMYQLLKNLFENALKYRTRDLIPEIAIHSESIDDYYIITVEDNGIGINLEHRDTIFQLFKRLHTSEQYSGTGIGLALAKKIVENHHGKIWIEPKSNGGSKFKFTLRHA